MKKYWIYMGALAIGLLLGNAILRANGRQEPVGTNSENARIVGNGENRRPPEAVGVRIGRLITAESVAMDASMPLDKATDVLFTERKSPMRTRAFLKNRIQMMTTDQLKQALMNGEIQTEAELLEATRRLAKEDPVGTFDQAMAGDFRIYGVANHYTFYDTLMETWADYDAPSAMARLKKMKHGGSQQETSLRFSAYWAKIDPEAAARHFSDLVYLRNMQGKDQKVFTDNVFADQIGTILEAEG